MTSTLGTDGGSPVNLDMGLLLYLTLDENEAGATARDLSGYSHDGEPSNPPPLPSQETPPVGFTNARSLEFDGTQLLDLGNPDSLNVEGEITIAAWVRPLALDGYRNIVAHGFRWDPSQELMLRISDEHYEFLAWDNNDHGARAPVPPGDVDNWRHLAGVYDGRMYRLYRDGELMAAVEDSFAPTRVDAPWAIGGRAALEPEQPRPFVGYIDDVHIYGRALSAAEVRALFRR
jgi:Concanavalin A-like lectin/glucanases superfamily